MSKVKNYKNPGRINFTGVIKSINNEPNSSTFIEFPFDIKEMYGYGNLIPIKATFDGRVKYQGSLAKMGGKFPMLLLRNDIKSQLNKMPGDEVSVIVDLDDKPRDVTIPNDVDKALKFAGLLEFFGSLAYTHRKEYIQWVVEAKKQETRDRRVSKMILELKSKSAR